jgi:serine/threonine protein phosphatase PrpC
MSPHHQDGPVRGEQGADPPLGGSLPVEWAVATRALGGQVESGDAGLVVSLADGALLAVIDGLGHGGAASVAASTAVRVLREASRASTTDLAHRCHAALQGTRGAVMTLAVLDARRGTLEWLGIGDVEGLLVRAGTPGSRERVLQRGGVVGYQLPTLRASTLPIHPGDTLILATDGIRRAFADALDLRGRSPRAVADAILAEHARPTDDALVLVARYVGGDA